MFVHILCIVCDKCKTEIQGVGPDATMVKLSRQARKDGWLVSSAGHYCPEHRRPLGR